MLRENSVDISNATVAFTSSDGELVPSNEGAIKIVSASYDITTDGGGLGTYNLPLSAEIPTGSIVYQVLLNKLENVNSENKLATGSLTLVLPQDIVVQTVVDSPTWNFGRYVQFTQNPPLTTAPRSSLLFTVDTEALTEGKFTVYLYYSSAPLE